MVNDGGSENRMSRLPSDVAGDGYVQPVALAGVPICGWPKTSARTAVATRGRWFETALLAAKKRGCRRLVPPPAVDVGEVWTSPPYQCPGGVLAVDAVHCSGGQGMFPPAGNGMRPSGVSWWSGGVVQDVT